METKPSIPATANDAMLRTYDRKSETLQHGHKASEHFCLSVQPDGFMVGYVKDRGFALPTEELGFGSSKVEGWTVIFKMDRANAEPRMIRQAITPGEVITGGRLRLLYELAKGD